LVDLTSMGSRVMSGGPSVAMITPLIHGPVDLLLEDSDSIDMLDRNIFGTGRLILWITFLVSIVRLSVLRLFFVLLALEASTVMTVSIMTVSVSVPILLTVALVSSITVLVLS